MTAGELRVELSRLTGMSEGEWDDLFTLPAEAQLVAVENYRDADWVQMPDRFAEVLAVLQALGTVAGVVSGVASAASAVAALRAL